MSAGELRGWIESYRLSPWDEARADLRAGIIASTIANVNRGKNSQPFDPRDFMPYRSRDDYGTDDDINDQFRAAFGLSERKEK